MRLPTQNRFVRSIARITFLCIFLTTPTQAIAAYNRTAFFDWGPYYYTQPRVLGVSYSEFEKLPPPEIPPDATLNQNPGTLPGNLLYPLETLAENAQLTLTFDPVQKGSLRLAFATERLNEARALSQRGQFSRVDAALSAYTQTMRTLTEDMTKSSASTSQAQLFLNDVEKTAALHQVVAQNLSLTSPPAAAQIWNSVSRASEHAMDAASDISQKAPIPEALSVSIQELKDQGLLTPEESDKLYGLNSRAQVRDELSKLVSAGDFPLAEIAKLDEPIAQVYPDAYKQIQTNLEFAELRTYETLPPPPAEILTNLKEWQERSDKNVPPPPDVRPYLYYTRAETLAKTIDFTTLAPDLQDEATNFYPQQVADNPTYTPPPTPLPSSSPLAEPSPTASTETTATSSSETLLPASPFPSPTPPTADPYLLGYSGPLPGSPTYIFKQFSEGLQQTFTFDPAGRAELALRLAEERLREANALADDKDKQTAYAQTLKNYQTLLTNASEQINSYNRDESRKLELAQELELSAARHNVVFEKGLLPPPDDPKLLTEAIIASENALDKSADIQGKPVLPEAFENRLQDLKAQGLLLSEEVDTLTRATTREEVRAKVRELTDLGTFPPADAKKLDEAQSLIAPNDYNQLVEVRKVEELQRLRLVQSEFAQTATLRSTSVAYEQRIDFLFKTIDPAQIRTGDLAGQQSLITALENINATASARPINAGQFGSDAVPGATPAASPPLSLDAVLATCPIGAVFKQFEGCVWENNDKRLNDYDQYRCERPGQYWSFATRTCLPYTQGTRQDDAQPVCPFGYTWEWQTQSCQAYTGGGPPPLPSPLPEPSPKDDADLALRSKSCPERASYKVPEGCVWDESGKPVYDSSQYRCPSGNYYSFTRNECVPRPDTDTPYPEDAQPLCKESASYWSWEEGKCKTAEIPLLPWSESLTLDAPQPTFAVPSSPFYFLKQAVEVVQSTTAFTPEAKQRVQLAHAKERFAEAYESLEKNDAEKFKDSLSKYTGEMQKLFNNLAQNPNLNDEAKKSLGETLAQEAAQQNLLLQKTTVLTSTDLTTPISAAVSVTMQAVDRAADLQGEPPIPSEIMEKIEALPEGMVPQAEKEQLTTLANRVEARLKLGALVSQGVLTAADTQTIDSQLVQTGAAQYSLSELKKLDELVDLTEAKEQITEKVTKTEDIALKLNEFQKSFQPGSEIPSEIRPYVRLTRIEEVAQTIRPDIVRLEDFGNRKDIQLAVATLKEEFRPTREAFKQLEDFRRTNPGKLLPPELARIEALSYSLGVRDSATACFLPSPPFAPNTPCPPPGAPIPVTSYSFSPSYVSPFSFSGSPPYNTYTSSTQTSGTNLEYGKGPNPESTGVCPNGYHWMYDNGGWCMGNSGNYSPSNYTLIGDALVPTSTLTQPGFTPYSPYYSTPGVPPGTYGYQGPGTYSVYPSSSGPGSYSPPYYYGPAPTTYTTTPLPGTVPGTGPQPTSPGQCPTGFHWMPPSYSQAGWCMADGGTYVPSGTSTSYPSGTATSSTPPPEGYNCGSQPYDPVTKRCRDGACPGGYNWDGSKCVASPPGGSYYTGGGYNYYSPNLTQSSCGPGYYWDGRGCIATYTGNNPYTYGGSSGSSSCTYPAGGCTGYNAYFDWGSCTCKTNTPGSCSTPSWGCGSGTWNSSTCSCQYPSGGSSSGGSTYCTPPSGGCGYNSWYDYSSCSCRSSSYSSSGSGSCTPPSGGCGSNSWYDYGTCSCRSGSSTYTPSSGSSSCSYPSAGCGSGWFDWSTCSCKSSSSTSSSGGTSSSSSSGSCPSGYHWMSDSGGWCMADGGSSGSSGSTSTPPSTSTSTDTSSSTTTTQPAESSAPAPAPAESSAPQPAPSS